MVDFGKSDKMIKISGKADKSNSCDGYNCDISFFINNLLLTGIFFFAFFYILAIEEIVKLIKMNV